MCGLVAAIGGRGNDRASPETGFHPCLQTAATNDDVPCRNPLISVVAGSLLAATAC